MKKALLIIFVLFSLNSYSQLSLKAMGYLFYFDYRLASSAACGIEYQDKQFGYEYKYQTYCNDGSSSFEYNLRPLQNFRFSITHRSNIHFLFLCTRK